MNKSDAAKIIVIDETIREGMQYQGVMLSLNQRIRILECQEKLGVDICQAGYAPAHPIEAQIIADLVRHAKAHNFKIKIASMGRLNRDDAEILMGTGVRDLHFHVHIKDCSEKDAVKSELNHIGMICEQIKQQHPESSISIALLDIGRSDTAFLNFCLKHLDLPVIDILSLPDTSGIMAPNQVFEKISKLVENITHPKISIHCHNDLGMACANSLMGIMAGSRILEASAIGIGERNGIADLYTTALHLKNQGYDLNLDTEKSDLFKSYYRYVDDIVFDQTGNHLITPKTPVFGDAVRTHVAGTHASGEYGRITEEKIYINGLCGTGLVKKFLSHNQINCPDSLLPKLTQEIKAECFLLNRAINAGDIKKILDRFNS